MYGLQVERINLKNKEERLQVELFLNSQGLRLDNDVDFTLAIRDKEIIKATCSKSGSILKCFAISPELRGEGIAGTLITALINRLFEEGRYHSFIFTKPKNIDIFTSLGYKVIHSVDEAALLESGIYDINKYLSDLSKKYSIDSKTQRSSLVMNCNPFTLGHQYLIETASKNSEEVLVFIVEENKSLFPFNIRYDLVRKGTEHLKNVKVVPGGEYIISSATFPSYFLREEGERLKAYTSLDAGIFAKYFCKEFNIKKRYVGEEPYCAVTNAYNQSLKEVLFEYGVDLKVIARKKSEEEVISASKVRDLIKSGNSEELKKFLPEVTVEFLNTNTGKEIMEKIRNSNSPH
jgi:[citrate (pro-3S)-lyase] ligase